MLAFFGVFTNAQRTICTFQMLSNGYTCRLENQIINNDNDMAEVGGVHRQGSGDANVVRLDHTTSVVNVFPSLIIDKFVNLQFMNLLMVEMRVLDRFIINCQRLFQIDISRNEIQTIPAGIFRNCDRLHRVTINHNQIRTIHDNAFMGMRALASLWLVNNEITAINSNMFLHTPILQSIFLNNNNIEVITTDTLRNLQELSWLALNNNRITTWTIDILSQNPRMTRLELSGNFIQTLDVNTFSNLPNLIELSIGSLLEEIPVFEGVQRLEHFSVIGCPIKRVTAASFIHMESLNNLWLGRNQIESVDFSMTTPRILTHLRTLSIFNNSISNLTHSNFEMLSGLTSLTLGSNQIEKLSIDTLGPVLPLISLDVNRNRIFQIDREIIEQSPGMLLLAFGNQCVSGNFLINSTFDINQLNRCFNSGMKLKVNGIILLLLAVLLAVLGKL